jgi:hypothetical protein
MRVISVLGLFVSSILFHATVAVDVPDPNFVPPRTVRTLNAEAYVGRWFLMYSSLIPTATYLQGGFCAIADYTDLSTANGKISFNIVNSLR